MSQLVSVGTLDGLLADGSTFQDFSFGATRPTARLAVPGLRPTPAANVTPTATGVCAVALSADVALWHRSTQPSQVVRVERGKLVFASFGDELLLCSSSDARPPVDCAYCYLVAEGLADGGGQPVRPS
jgi:hypothetical protein